MGALSGDPGRRPTTVSAAPARPRRAAAPGGPEQVVDGPAVTVVSKPCSSTVAPTTTRRRPRHHVHLQPAHVARAQRLVGRPRRYSSWPLTGRTGGSASAASPRAPAPAPGGQHHPPAARLPAARSAHRRQDHPGDPVAVDRQLGDPARHHADPGPLAGDQQRLTRARLSTWWSPAASTPPRMLGARPARAGGTRGCGGARPPGRSGAGTGRGPRGRRCRRRRGPRPGCRRGGSRPGPLASSTSAAKAGQRRGGQVEASSGARRSGPR
jgi:hypothetical protein